MNYDFAHKYSSFQKNKLYFIFEKSVTNFNQNFEYLLISMSYGKRKKG